MFANQCIPAVVARNSVRCRLFSSCSEVSSEASGAAPTAIMDDDDLPMDDLEGLDAAHDQVAEASSDEVESQDAEAEEVSAKKRRGRPAGKAKPKAKANPAGNRAGKIPVFKHNGKKTTRAKDGKKLCPACNKFLPISAFPAGSGQCGPDRKAIQNLKYASVAQGQQKWWEEVCQSAEKLQKVVEIYHARFPEETSKKRTSFPIAQYIEERRQESSIIMDGVYEMMTERAYVAWMAKPKNGCMDPQEVAAQWKEEYSTPKAVTDNLGTNPKWKQRVAIKKADELRLRDAQIAARGYQLKGKEEKIMFRLQQRRWNQGCSEDLS